MTRVTLIFMVTLPPLCWELILTTKVTTWKNRIYTQWNTTPQHEALGFFTSRERNCYHIYVSLTWLQPNSILIKITCIQIINHIEVFFRSTPSISVFAISFPARPNSLLYFPNITSDFSAPLTKLYNIPLRICLIVWAPNLSPAVYHSTSTQLNKNVTDF